MPYDVAIIGGGPAGATVGALLRKYDPRLRVLILERERFPRDHIGESLLPPTSEILHEMGCWDAIEGAGFPIKVGATYRWGRRPELWDFNFVPPQDFRDEERPAKFEGLRTFTAFQVDRSRYDAILLDHAQAVGCEVRQQAKVSKVNVEGEQVRGLELHSGETVQANHYVDASGNSGILRRALNVSCDYPSALKNIAVYDYWQNAEWNVKIGVGGTRILVLSLGYGWLWFIPLGPTRTSIGLVVPAEYYKTLKKRPQDLYREALANEPIISGLIANAKCERRLQTTKDWSFIAEKHAGPNWFLVGECSGFADPILSAGVTMAHIGAQQLAYTILEIERGEIDKGWLLSEFERKQKQRILTHIRFGDYWYTANRQLTDLKDFTTQLASDVGLTLDPEQAWDWIARGGFIDEEAVTGFAGFGLDQLRASSDFLIEIAPGSPLEANNILDLDLEGAEQSETAAYLDGHVRLAPCYARNGRVLPVRGQLDVLVNALKREREHRRLMDLLENLAKRFPDNPIFMDTFCGATEALEAMIRDGWIRASYDPRLPLCKILSDGSGFRLNKDKESTAEN